MADSAVSTNPPASIDATRSAGAGETNNTNVSETPIWARLGRYSLLITLSFALIGVVIGVLVSGWEASETKKVTLQWIGLPGDLFIRTLKAIVLPMVFVNVSAAIVDMMSIGRVSTVGWTTIGLYMATTVVAAGFGFISILTFQDFISPREDMAKPGTGEVTLGCGQTGFLLTQLQNGSIACLNATAVTASNTFILNDVNNTFEKTSTGPKDDISFSDTIYNGIFTKLFTQNIFDSFVAANFAAVVVFSLAFGMAISRVMNNPGGLRFGYVLVLLKELDVILLFILDWVIYLTPLAVFSLVIKAIGSQQDVGKSFNQVVLLAVPAIMAMLLHFLLVHVGIMMAVTKKNPFNYLRFMLPAQTMAFASASSAATIPVTLRSIAMSGAVPEAIAHFVVPLGATINMDGGAIYFPCACIWLAKINGTELDAAACFLLVIIATIGSVGTAPVPSASLALILTAYNTAFNKSGTPPGFELVVAIDWFMDRCRTVLNVTGDTVVSAMVAHLCPLKTRGITGHVQDMEAQIQLTEVPARQGGV